MWYAGAIKLNSIDHYQSAQIGHMCFAYVQDLCFVVWYMYIYCLDEMRSNLLVLDLIEIVTTSGVQTKGDLFLKR